MPKSALPHKNIQAPLTKAAALRILRSLAREQDGFSSERGWEDDGMWSRFLGLPE